MTGEQKQLVRAAANVAICAALVWYSMPGRPPLGPYAWRSAARGVQVLADHAQALSLWCRSRYWKAVRR